jgi:hypothetical protein
MVWNKGRTIPWSGQGRLRNAHELIMFFSKTRRFKWKLNRVREADALAPWWVRFPERYHPEGKAPSTVWDYPIPRQGSFQAQSARHACPLPPDMVDRMISLSTDVGDIVFDPFAGTGTVPCRATSLGRRGVGMDIVDYKSATHTDKAIDFAPRTRNPKTALIPKLRSIKYGGQIARRLSEAGISPLAVIVVHRTARSNGHTWTIQSDVQVVTRSRDTRKAMKLVDDLVSHAPLSKFGITAHVTFVLERDAHETLREGRWWTYSTNRHWQADRRWNPQAYSSLMRSDAPTLIANVNLHVQAI